MKIAVHAQVLTAPRLFGIGYYLYNLLQAIGNISPSDTFYLFSGGPLQFAPGCPTLVPVIKTKNIPNRCFSYIGFPWMASKTGAISPSCPRKSSLSDSRSPP